MYSVFYFINRFFLYSILISAVSETIAGLLMSINKAFFITPEEEAIMEIQKAVIQKELEEEAKEMNMNVHGYKDVISMYFKWAEEHEVINIIVLYIFCIIPIVNIVVFLNNIHKIIKLFKIKFKIIVHRFK